MVFFKPPITVGLREIMKKIDLGQAIETLANVGVILGIIFLVVELRQSNELMEADARFNRLTRSADAWQSMAENGDLTELQVRSENGEVLSEVEQRRVDAARMRFLMNLEWHYGDHKHPNSGCGSWRSHGRSDGWSASGAPLRESDDSWTDRWKGSSTFAASKSSRSRSSSALGSGKIHGQEGQDHPDFTTQTGDRKVALFRLG